MLMKFEVEMSAVCTLSYKLTDVMSDNFHLMKAFNWTV
jgi:hypothetical protein